MLQLKMRIEYTEDADLDFNDPDYDTLKTGIVIFPDDSDDVEKIEKLKEFLEIWT